MKLRVLLTAILFTFIGSASLQAQKLVTIKEIQTSVSFEADSSVLNRQKVKVRGIVATDPNLYYQTPDGSRPRAFSFWILEKGQSGPQTGLIVRVSRYSDGEAIGVGSLKRGQEVELTGTVGYFFGETQLELDPKTPVTTLDFAALPPAAEISVGTLNNDQGVEQPSGEAYQGCFVSFKNVRVIWSNETPNRGNFELQDGEGNRVRVFDANLDMRLSRNGFVRPAVGVNFTEIKGFVTHTRRSDDKYYQICLYDTAGAKSDPKTVPPAIEVSKFTRNPVCPKPSETVSITVPISHPAGVDISSVSLYYAVGASNLTYTQVAMTNAGGVYSGQIPAQAAGSFVHYYVEATDANNNKMSAPFNSRSGILPFSYTSSAEGCKITDIQFTSSSIQKNTTRYDSGYRGLTVTGVSGVVTSTLETSNLGYVFIQDRAASSWGGIHLAGDLTTLKVGDSVVVESATVGELFGLTYLTGARVRVVGAVAPVRPVDLDLNLFNPDSANILNESYEGMLVRFRKVPKGISVINRQAETCSSNFVRCMDWVIGTDKNNPNKGIRVMTGGPAGSRNSKAVKYINDSTWIANLNSGVTAELIKDQTFDAVQGIMSYDRDRVKLLPRNDADVIITLSRKEAMQLQASVYPNPTNGKMFINSEESIGTVQIFDVTGRNVFSQVLNSHNAELDLSQLTEGAYVLKAVSKSGNASLNTRIVIVK